MKNIFNCLVTICLQMQDFTLQINYIHQIMLNLNRKRNLNLKYWCGWHFLIKVFLNHTLERQKVLQLIVMCTFDNVCANCYHLLKQIINVINTSFGLALLVHIMPMLRSTGLWIKRQLKKIDLNVVQKIMLSARKKLRKIEDQSSFSIL